MLLTSKLKRKRLLLRLLALFTPSHVLAAVAWNFAVLVIARLGIAILHAIFWSITSSLVVRVAPINKGSQVIGMLALGTSLAMVLWLPLGRVVGELFGWRITFFAIGALAAAETLFLWKILPFLPSRRAGSLASLPMLVRRPLLLALYLLTFLIVGAYFTIYSYIELFVAKFNPAGDHFVSYVLLAFGASGIGGGALLGHQIATRFGLKHIGEAGTILGALGLASYLYASVKFAEKNKAQCKDAENLKLNVSFLTILIKFKAADMDSLKFKLAFGL